MMSNWNAAWRELALPELAARDWDLIVVGGGISGAGILREAARRGRGGVLPGAGGFALGHFQPFLENGPRRAALYRQGPAGADSGFGARAPASAAGSAGAGRPLEFYHGPLPWRLPWPQGIRQLAGAVRRSGRQAQPSVLPFAAAALSGSGSQGRRPAGRYAVLRCGDR